MNKRISFVTKRMFTFVLILSAAFAVTAQSKKEKKQAAMLQQQADSSYIAKDYRSAADLYAQSLALVPNNNYGHYKKGFAHYNLQEYDKAVDEFTTALGQGYSPIDVYRIRSFVYFDKKDWDNALGDIQKGLALAPRDVGFLKMLGEINLSRNALSDALDAYKRAAEAAPNDADIFYNIARVYFALGDVQQQGIAAEAALSKGTRFPAEAHYLLANAYHRQKRADEAIAEYQRAISSKPEMYDAYRNLADVYRSEARYDDAIKISKQALLKFPQDGNIYTDLSWYYSLANRPDDAVQAGRAAVTFLPKQALGYTNLCRAYNDTKEYQLAINTCNAALGLSPGDGESYFYLARAYDLLNKPGEATKYYKLAVPGLETFASGNPDYSDGWYLLGNAYFADKQLDKAVEAYRQCLVLSPRFANARFNLGVVYVKQNNKAAAVEQYSALRPLDPASAEDLKALIDKL